MYDLESTLQTLPNRVVGRDVKSVKTTKSYVIQMLLLFVGTRSLQKNGYEVAFLKKRGLSPVQKKRG